MIDILQNSESMLIYNGTRKHLKRMYFDNTGYIDIIQNNLPILTIQNKNPK